MRTTKKMPPTSVRLDPDVRAALEEIAREQERSLAWIINKALRAYIEQETRAKRPRK